LSLVIGLEPVGQLTVPRIVIVKIDSHECLHCGGEYFLVTQDLRQSASIEKGLTHEEIKEVVHGAHLRIVGHTREIGEKVLFTVDSLEFFGLTVYFLQVCCC
jgi:hypothetical protein